MSLSPGAEVQLAIEKPAAGGRMIARHEGQVVLVLGGIPGERVLVRVERADRSLAFAEVVDVLEASPDRREAGDLRCGGCLYAHIEYRRQLTLKADVIADAFGRLGRITTPPLDVAASRQHGYRMRARLHARSGHIGFYREGSHDICDAAQTAQLSEAAIAAGRGAIEAINSTGAGAASVMISENLAADERALYVELGASSSEVEAAAAAAVSVAGVTGCTVSARDGAIARAGIPAVSDPLGALTDGRARTGRLQRRAESFFQANRFLLPSLVTAVMGQVPAAGEVLDLYAGVGLFSVCLAGAGRRGMFAVEGDRTSAADLLLNVGPFSDAIAASTTSVEDYLSRRRARTADTIIIDPPRTGVSKAAMQAVARHGASRVIYVSCDPPTMARDARRLLDAGYAMTSLRAFDLFPNTPHVESLGVFDRA